MDHVDLGRLRRGARRACLAGAAACLGLALVSPAADAQGTDPTGGAEAGPRPQAFSGSASALAASVELDRPGLLPIEDLFRFIAADGEGTYRTSEQRGRASLFYPGSGAILGPSLACSQFPADNPVIGPIVQACLGYSFPLSVTADSLEPDRSTEGAVALGRPTDPVSAHAVGARAHAGPDAVTTDAAVNDLRVLGAPAVGTLPAVPGFEGLEPGLLTIGSATATTDQHIDETGALVVDAEAALSDIRLIGGLVRIGSLVAHTRIVDGEGDPVTEATMHVGGVTVAGQPARLSERGLEVGEASAPIGPLLEALNRQLAAALESVSFRSETLPVEQGVDDDGIAFARVGGLLIEMAVPVSGLPTVPGPLGDLELNGDYIGTVLLGNVGARAIASNFDPFDVPSPPLMPGGAGGSLGGDALGSTPTPAGVSGAPAPGAPASPGAGAPAAPGDPTGQPILDLFADRLRLLYLAFTLAALALCLAPGLTMPARLPSGRP